MAIGEEDSEVGVWLTMAAAVVASLLLPPSIHVAAAAVDHVLDDEVVCHGVEVLWPAQLLLQVSSEVSLGRQLLFSRPQLALELGDALLRLCT